MRIRALIKSLTMASAILMLAGIANAQSGRWLGRIQMNPSPSPSSAVSNENSVSQEDSNSRAAHREGQSVEINAKKPTIVGSWLLTISIPDNPPPFNLFNGFWALTGDGILIASAQGDVTPAPFPSITSQYGAWTQLSTREFAATFKAILYDLSTGDNLGQFKLQQSMTLSESGDNWSGPFKLTVTDPGGGIVAVVTGTAQASRIKVEPLE